MTDSNSIPHVADCTLPPVVRPFVGQVLYRLNVGNNARHVAQKLTPVVVSSVGRKYFTVKINDGGYGMESKHLIDGWVQECGGYCPGYSLYVSEQAWADEKEQRELMTKLRNEFEYSRKPLPLKTLREIAEILWLNPTVDHRPTGKGENK